MTDEYLAPMVAGALGYVSGHVAKLDTTISLGIGAATAVAGYIASKQSCSSKRRGKIAEDDRFVSVLFLFPAFGFLEIRTDVFYSNCIMRFSIVYRWPGEDSPSFSLRRFLSYLICADD